MARPTEKHLPGRFHPTPSAGVPVIPAKHVPAGGERGAGIQNDGSGAYTKRVSGIDTVIPAKAGIQQRRSRDRGAMNNLTREVELRVRVDRPGPGAEPPGDPGGPHVRTVHRRPACVTDHSRGLMLEASFWIPAFAGMTGAYGKSSSPTDREDTSQLLSSEGR